MCASVRAPARGSQPDASCAARIEPEPAYLAPPGTSAGLWPMRQGAPVAPSSLSSAELCGVLSGVRQRWALPMVACTFKGPLAAGAEAAAVGQKRTNTLKAGGNRRYSAVAFSPQASHATTAEMAVEHHPIQVTRASLAAARLRYPPSHTHTSSSRAAARRARGDAPAHKRDPAAGARRLCGVRRWAVATRGWLASSLGLSRWAAAASSAQTPCATHCAERTC